MSKQTGPRPTIVILGGGFGGLSAARALARHPVNVVLIDKRNHHLFQPLLYQVATAGLSPADIAGSIRAILRDQDNARVILDQVCGIDRVKREVLLAGNPPVLYDWLIVATGARHSYFGRDDWSAFAPGIKTIDDATAVRTKVLLALERAEAETDKAKRDELLTFAVVGGGPTGVEMAGAIAELARQSVSKDFRSITPHCSQVWLMQRGDRLLPSFPPALSHKARDALEKLGVRVRLDADVQEISASGLKVDGDVLPAATVIWAAGVFASPAATWLDCATDRSGRAVVSADLHPCGDARLFVIGDTAACTDCDGQSVPGVAPAAKQQGRYAADAILLQIAGKPVPPFRYADYGQMATIGRARAVFAYRNWRFSGHVAWLFWCLAHVWFLNGLRNRLSVTLSWVWNYFTFERGARLITGDVLPEGQTAATRP